MDDVFKVPQIPEPTTAIITTETETKTDEQNEETTRSTIIGPTMPPSDFKAPARHKNLQYDVPEWSGIPTNQYSMEVVRNGSIIENIYLSNRAYTVFGRSPDSDIVLEHPTISRYHAIIQYKSDYENNLAKGLYLYDCGSTHGTFLNKKRIDSKVYVRLKVDFVIKFGQSTRLYIVQGDEAAREESQNSTDTGEELTHEKMKKFHEKRSKKLAEVRARREQDDIEAHQNQIEMDWGMGFDGQEAEENPVETVKRTINKEKQDEETNQTEIEKDLKNRLEYKKAKNDQSVLNEIISKVDEPIDSNEETVEKELFYLKDPKRALTTFFEREGAELVYDVEDRHFGSYRCTIRLPIVDELGHSMQAEVEDQHCKRKDIINRCILEACRILDEHGVLREGTSSTNSVRVQQMKRQLLEENDFYEEDEDTFFDRTGDLEKKRLKRMEWAGVTSQEKPVENFHSLKEKLSKLYHEQIDLEEKIENAQQMEQAAEQNSTKNDQDDDDLDIYIRQLKQGERLTMKVKSQWRKRLLEIENEERQLVKLIKVCKPREFEIFTWKKTIRDEAKQKLNVVRTGRN